MTISPDSAKKPITAASPILSASGIKKSFLYKGKISTVLDKIDFQIEQGEFISIIGSSGCGKSTFLELLAGITFPDRGQILLNGEDITGKSGYLGYMPQDDGLFPWLNAMQNMLLPVRVKSGDIGKAKATIAELLPLFGLQDHAGMFPHKLTGGLKQRVALLRTYMCNAQVMLLDEPLANLDAITRGQLQAWLKDIVERLNLTIILVTHDIDEAILLSDRIELMSKDPGSFIKSIQMNNSGTLDEVEKLSLKQQIKAMFIGL